MVTGRGEDRNGFGLCVDVGDSLLWGAMDFSQHSYPTLTLGMGGKGPPRTPAHQPIPVFSQCLLRGVAFLEASLEPWGGGPGPSWGLEPGCQLAFMPHQFSQLRWGALFRGSRGDFPRLWFPPPMAALRVASLLGASFDSDSLLGTCPTFIRHPSSFSLSNLCRLH